MFDPVMIVLSIILYFIAVLPLSVSIFVIFFVKAVPIFLGTLYEFWKSISLFKSVTWYMKVLAGQHEPTSNVNQGNVPRRSGGHDGWLKGLKKATKGIKKFIEGYAKIKLWKSYKEVIKEYTKSLKCINPKYLVKICKSYCSDFSPTKVYPKEVGCSILILFFPILMVSIMWTLGLVLVLVIPPITFLTAFGLWILMWPVIILFQPLAYVVGWILIIFGLPVLYLLLWIMILVGPWILCIFGCISGPILALKITVMMIKYTYFNPIGEE